MFNSSIKIEHAESLLLQLRDGLETFYQSSPFKIELVNEEEFDYFVVQILKEIPNEIKCLSSDVIQNLRTTLDYALFERVLSELGGDIPLEVEQQIQFRFFEDDVKLTNFLTRKFPRNFNLQTILRKSLSKFQSFSELDPYWLNEDTLHGGAGTDSSVRDALIQRLERLIKLSNIDKHRYLISHITMPMLFVEYLKSPKNETRVLEFYPFVAYGGQQKICKMSKIDPDNEVVVSMDVKDLELGLDRFGVNAGDQLDIFQELSNIKYYVEIYIEALTET